MKFRLSLSIGSVRLI